MRLEAESQRERWTDGTGPMSLYVLLTGTCAEKGGTARKFGISRVLRIHVRSMAESSIHSETSAAHQFDRWVSMDFGKSGAQGERRSVGCKKIKNTDYHFPPAIYYSLPGRCGAFKIGHKPAGCEIDQPGGECPPGVEPDGKRCMWSAKVVGFVSIDELVGIQAKGFADHAAFCKGDAHEADLCFWQEPKSGMANAERTETLGLLFKARYPEQGDDRPAPNCEWEG